MTFRAKLLGFAWPAALLAAVSQAQAQYPRASAQYPYPSAQYPYPGPQYPYPSQQFPPQGAQYPPQGAQITRPVLPRAGPQGAAPWPPQAAAKTNNWDITIGPGVAMQPEYIGSNKYILWPMPIIEIKWRDKIFLSAKDGFGWNMVKTRHLNFGPLVHYYLGSQDYPSGMDSVDAGGQFGAFVNFAFGHWRLDAKALYAFSGSSEGARANVGLSYGTRINKVWKIVMRAGVSYFNDNEMKTYFGVSQREASSDASSGMRQYTAKKGFADVGFGAEIAYGFTKNWSGIIKLKATQLLGDAADSPLTTKDFQGYGGVGFAYTF